MVTNFEFDENENPNFVDGCNIKGKQGSYIKGKDVIHLDAPEICFPKDAPLKNTEKRELYSILDELFQGGGEGGDWQPPEDWIPVPEPEDYDIYALLYIRDSGYNAFKIAFTLQGLDDESGYYSHGTFFCDWGDGEADNYKSPKTHTYAASGLYLVHIIGSETAKYINLYSEFISKLLIFKSGNEIICNSTFSGANSLVYVKINNSSAINLNQRYFFNQNYALKKIDINNINAAAIGDTAFFNCYALDFKDINFANCASIDRQSFGNCHNLKTISFPNVTSVGESAFTNCYGLEHISLPNCTSVGDSAFRQCFNLKTISLPNCTSIGAQVFLQCHNLQEIVVAEDCVFGTNCFASCYSLYPRPDGSIN